MEQKPIGRINQAYLGCLLLVMAGGAGMAIGILLMLAVLKVG